MLDPVATESLHLTLGRIGFTEELDADLVPEVLAAAERRCRRLADFQLTVGPLAGSRGAVRWIVAPWNDLVDRRRHLTAATRSVLADRCVMDTDVFRPHISIAYVNAETPAAELVAAVARAEPVEQVTVTVRAATLVILRREDHAYRIRAEGVSPSKRRRPIRTDVCEPVVCIPRGSERSGAIRPSPEPGRRVLRPHR